MAGEIIPEHRARSNRNAGRHHRGFASDFPGIRSCQEDGKSDTCVGFEMTEFPAIAAQAPPPRGADHGQQKVDRYDERTLSSMSAALPVSSCANQSLGWHIGVPEA